MTKSFLLLVLIVGNCVQVNAQPSSIEDLNRGFYRTLGHNPDSAHLFADQIIALVEGDTNSEAYAMALYQKSAAQWLSADYYQAMILLNRARLIFEKLGIKAGLANAENLSGIILIDLERYLEAKNRLHRALRFTEHDSSNIEINLGLAHLELGLNDSAAFYFRNAIASKARRGDSINLAIAWSNLGRVYANLNKRDSAFTFFNRAIAVGLKMQDYKAAGLALIEKSTLYHVEQDYESGKNMALQALAMARKYELPENRIKAFQSLYKIYRSIGITDSANFYQRLFLIEKDSVLGLNKLAQIDFLEDEVHRIKEVELRQRVLKERLVRIIWVGLASLLVLLIVGISYVVYLRAKNRIAEEKKRSKKIELDLERSKRTLLTKIILEEDQQQMIENLQKSLTHFDDDRDLKAFVERKLKLLKNSETKWETFVKGFNDVHPHFFQRLNDRFPSLTPGDQKLAALLSINFSSKQIADLLGVESTSVDMARYRLRKKVNLENSESLSELLISLNS